jgi:hypothetical protein
VAGNARVCHRFVTVQALAMWHVLAEISDPDWQSALLKNQKHAPGIL